MEIFDIINEANQSSKITGKIVFFISGGVACFNFFKPGYVPTNLLSGMFTLLTFSFIGMFIFAFKYRKVPHLTNTNCPKCQSRMVCIKIKCLDEFQNNCDFSVNLSSNSRASTSMPQTERSDVRGR